jgi:hypothetical protein
VTVRQFTTAQYAAIVSTVAFFVSCGSLYVSKRSYDLSAAKDEREIMDKMPAIDVQVRPAGGSSASVTISIINRADINIAPLDITVEHSFEIGDLYLSSAQQSIDLLKSALSLSPIGTIAPKGIGTLKARVAESVLAPSAWSECGIPFPQTPARDDTIGSDQPPRFGGE